ncbi:hypothetical protein KFK09_007081 [Dendrobium nobile]|uniref:HAT C-terminal dimerisation domain-containing protein n=1 Tax=Dendrobium nobile TaxID=94219 RepID=A0A8T3BVC8_DENNO|nr:hypothetical protein KFK09_007081 [Dendrobium nobile]
MFSNGRIGELILKVHIHFSKEEKSNQAKYRILSRLAVEILTIAISTVASESTFSVGERVVDTYHSKLGIEMVQALICWSNRVRAHYGLKGRMKEEDDDDEIEIPIPCT